MQGAAASVAAPLQCLKVLALVLHLQLHWLVLLTVQATPDF